MAETSSIEWTDATWNPIVGCSLHSPGCKRCYAMRVAWRLMHNPHPKIAAKFAGTARLVKRAPVFTGRVNMDEETLLAPLRRRKPTVYFVNSLSDLFHANVPDEWIDRIFAVMALCPQHIFQVLTKRSDRMRAYLSTARAHPVAIETMKLTLENFRMNSRIGKGCILQGDIVHLRDWPLPNVWLGVSVEDQQRADERIPDLLATPAAVRFLSCEPLLGPVDLNALAEDCCGLNALSGLRENPYGAIVTRRFGTKIDWLICGGESGPRARPMHPDWARSLRDQCAAAGVPFFFKQWGSCLPCNWDEDEPGAMTYVIDEAHSEVDYDDLGRAQVVQAHGREYARFGHKRTGRLLDGRHYDGRPA